MVNKLQKNKHNIKNKIKKIIKQHLSYIDLIFLAPFCSEILLVFSSFPLTF